MAEYRIEFSIQAAEHIMGSMIENREWETSGDMPDPSTVDYAGGD